MSKKVNKISDEDIFEEVNDSRGRKLTVKNSTFNLEDGSYKGTITEAFWYKNADEKDRVMFIIQLDEDTEFKNSVDGDWIEKYPFSQLISQANVEYVEDFIGLDVIFEVCNREGDYLTFTNIRKISLDE